MSCDGDDCPLPCECGGPMASLSTCARSSPSDFLFNNTTLSLCPLVKRVDLVTRLWVFCQECLSSAAEQTICGLSRFAVRTMATAGQLPRADGTDGGGRIDHCVRSSERQRSKPVSEQWFPHSPWLAVDGRGWQGLDGADCVDGGAPWRRPGKVATVAGRGSRTRSRPSRHFLPWSARPDLRPHPDRPARRCPFSCGFQRPAFPAAWLSSVRHSADRR